MGAAKAYAPPGASAPRVTPTAIKREVGKSFEDSARFYKMSGLDNSGKYAYLAAEVAKLQATLK